jgi:periplasmic mercuric ion binding protein
MKIILFLTTFLIPLLGFSSNQKAEFKVYGACGMCETRIENAAKSVDGVHLPIGTVKQKCSPSNTILKK